MIQWGLDGSWHPNSCRCSCLGNMMGLVLPSSLDDDEYNNSYKTHYQDGDEYDEDSARDARLGPFTASTSAIIIILFG